VSNKYFWKKKKFVCRDTGERATGYEDYLKTEHWRQLRERIYQERNGICERCGRELDGVFEVHHKSYKSVGHEADTSLMLVCPECHRGIHAEMKAKAAETRVANDIKRAKSAEYEKRIIEEGAREINALADVLATIEALEFQDLLDILRLIILRMIKTDEFAALFNSKGKHLSKFLNWNVVEAVEAATRSDE